MDALSTVLAWGVLAAAAVVFLGVEIWLLGAAWRTPRRAPPAPLPASAPRYRLSRGWEVVWTLLPALAVLALALLTASRRCSPSRQRGPSGTPTALPPHRPDSNHSPARVMAPACRWSTSACPRSLPGARA